jgi:hypothetical protein
VNNTEKKARLYLRIIAIMLGVGGIAGIAIAIYFEVAVLSQNAGKLPLTAIAIGLMIPFALCVWTGIGLWKKKSWAFTWAQMLLIAQIPYFNISGFNYKFYTALTLDIGYTESRLNFWFQLGSHLTFQIEREAEAFAFGINLAAVLALYFLGKAMVLQKETTAATRAEI